MALDSDSEPWQDALAGAKLYAHKGAGRNILEDGGFETFGAAWDRSFATFKAGEQPQKLPATWQPWLRSSQYGTIGFDGDGAHQGSYGLFIKGAAEASCSQCVPAKPGVLYHANASIRGSTMPGGRGFVHFGFLDAQGNVLKNHKIWSLPYGATPWSTIHFWLRAPDNAAKVFIALCALGQGPEDYAQMDDCALEELAPMPL